MCTADRNGDSAAMMMMSNTILYFGIKNVSFVNAIVQKMIREENIIFFCLADQQTRVIPINEISILQAQ